MLKIVDFKGNVLGEVQQTTDGGLTLDVKDERFHEELNAILRRVIAEPIYIIWGRSFQESGRTMRETRRTLVEKTDPAFLSAMADWITRSKITVNGERIRALVIRSQKE